MPTTIKRRAWIGFSTAPHSLKPYPGFLPGLIVTICNTRGRGRGMEHFCHRSRKHCTNKFPIVVVSADEVWLIRNLGLPNWVNSTVTEILMSDHDVGSILRFYHCCLFLLIKWRWWDLNHCISYLILVMGIHSPHDNSLI